MRGRRASRISLSVRHDGGGGTLREDVAYALEFSGLVEKPARAQPLGVSPIGLGGEVGQHVHLDARLALVYSGQHIEAAALRELEVEHDDLRLRLEDSGERFAHPGG